MKMTEKEIYKKLDKLTQLTYELRFGIEDPEDKEVMEQIDEMAKELFFKYIK